MTGNKKNDLKFSTRTIICELNFNLDIDKLYHILPIACPLKEFGKTNICYMYNKTNFKGDPQKKKKKTKKSKDSKDIKSFRNSLNLLIESKEGSLYTIKIGRLGRFHVTGVKDHLESYDIVKYLVSLMLLSSEKDIFLNKDDDIDCHLVKVKFLTIMTNYIYNTEFKIDKEKLNNLLNTQSDFINLYETSFGYTGVNVKKEIDIKKFQNKIDMPIHVYDKKKQNWTVLYEKREIFGKLNKPKHNTFLVFNSGKCIVSGIQEELMQEDFDLFSTFLQSNRHYIEEFISC